MTKRAQKIKTALSEHMYGSAREVKFICESLNDLDLSKSKQFDFAIVRYGRTRAFISIEYDDRGVYSIWNFYNFETYFDEILYNHIKDAIFKLNCLDYE